MRSADSTDESRHTASRRAVLSQTLFGIMSGVILASKGAAAEDVATVTEDIEGSDGTITKIGFAYPRNWKYERDVSQKSDTVKLTSCRILKLNSFR